VNWNDPNQIATFAALGQWAGAIGSLLAVIAAAWIALRSGKASQRQSLQARYDAARPILVIEGNDPVYETDTSAYAIRDSLTYKRSLVLHTQPGKKGWIDWNEPEHLIALKNIGSGSALNVMSVIFGPEALEDKDKLLDASKNDYWQHKINILSVGERKECKYHKPAQHLLKGNVNRYSFLAPPQPLIDPSDKKRLLYEEWAVCRITTTYHDIFKRKHASIFDLDIRGYWIMRAILEDIPSDLYDLQKDDQSSRFRLLRKCLSLFSKKDS
jgi:hypothetical protein